ncbi:MAG: penicillin-binding protein 2 [Synechococcales bacterium]|nr:penicillin-binding protein 2 [Synechococcales bacterium]
MVDFGSRRRTALLRRRSPQSHPVRKRQRSVPSSSASRPPRLRAAAPPRTRLNQSGGNRLIPRRAPRLPRFRLILVWGLLLAGIVGLSLNLVRLQIFASNELARRARAQQEVAVTPFIPRLPISDRQGNIVALDRQVYALYAHPILFQESSAAYRTTVATQLAKILNREVGDLVEELSQSDTGIKIQEQLPQGVANQIQALRLDGLELVPYQERYYPQRDLFSHIIGYVNVDREGQVGVEYSQQTLLARPTAAVRLRRSGDGSIIPNQIPEGLVQHEDLYLKLTLDTRLQRIVRDYLQAQIEAYSAEKGAALVMDVRNGAILAMVAEPMYDPNRFYEADLATLKNWTVSSVYEPGSTFKPINLAIALEAGVIQPDDTFYDEGQIYLNDWTIANSDYQSYGARGQLSVTDILKYSSNVGMVRIMQQLEAEDYFDWLERLGLGQTTGIDLPFEVASVLKSREQFTRAAIEPATTAFGQGIALSPVQLVQLHAAAVNGGKLVTPHVVEGLFDSNQTLHWQPDRPPVKQVFSPETSRAVVAMMEAVVEDGTGKTAQIPGYRVAGKTGTAQKASARGGYDARARVTSFVGVIPAESPRYVVLVSVDEPKGSNTYGSTVAAPVVKLIMESLITLEQIPKSSNTDATSESGTASP